MNGDEALRIALALLASAAAPVAAAADWSLSGFASARTEAVSETGGDNPESGLRGVGDLGFTLTARTPTTRITLAPAARLLLSSLDSDGSDATPLPRLNGALAHEATPRLSLTASASVIPDFLDDAQFEDSGGRAGGGEGALQITAQGRAGAAYRVDPRQSLSLSAFARLRTFSEDEDGLSDSRAWGFDGLWSRDLTPRTRATVGPTLSVFSSDAENGADGETLSLAFGALHQLSPRMSVDAGIGPALTRSSRPGEEDETDLTGTGRLDLRYTTDDAVYRLGLTQGVDQNSDGELENRTVLRAGLSARLTDRLRGGLDTTAGYQTPLGGAGSDRTFFSLTPSLTYDVTPAWSVSVGYRFRAADRDDLETSHTVFLQLSRGLSLLP